MSTKPATKPRWATDQTNNDAPSSGQMDTGWTPGQTGVSDYDNWVKYWSYKWIEWLDDGDCAFDALTATTLATTGIATVGGALTVTGTSALNDDVTLASGKHITLSGLGQYKHGQRFRAIIFEPYYSSGSVTYTNNLAGIGVIGVVLAAGTTTYAKLDGLPSGKTITAVVARGVGAITGSANATYEVFEQFNSGLSSTLTSVSSAVSSAATNVTVTLTTPWVTGASSHLFLRITVPGAETYGYMNLSLTYTE